MVNWACNKVQSINPQPLTRYLVIVPVWKTIIYSKIICKLDEHSMFLWRWEWLWYFEATYIIDMLIFCVHMKGCSAIMTVACYVLSKY